MSIWFHNGTKLTRRRIAADIRNMRSRVDELLPIAEENEGFVTAVQARSLGIKGSVLARLTQRGTWDLRKACRISAAMWKGQG